MFPPLVIVTPDYDAGPRENQEISDRGRPRRDVLRRECRCQKAVPFRVTWIAQLDSFTLMNERSAIYRNLLFTRGMKALASGSKSPRPITK
jgi:hypothetical protein